MKQKKTKYHQNVDKFRPRKTDTRQDTSNPPLLRSIRKRKKDKYHHKNSDLHQKIETDRLKT